MLSFIRTAWLASRALLRLGHRTLGWSLPWGLSDLSVKWQGQGELLVGLRSLSRILKVWIPRGFWEMESGPALCPPSAQP